MKSPKKKRLGAGRVAFLARVGAIKEKIDAGYTMASIYEDYQRDLGIGYKQFVNYVNKFIRDKPTPEKEEDKPERLAPAEKDAPTNNKPAADKPITEKEPEDDEDDIEGKAASGDFF